MAAPAHATVLSGIQKAAILLISVGDQASAELLKRLGDDEVQAVTAAIASLPAISREQAEVGSGRIPLRDVAFRTGSRRRGFRQAHSDFRIRGRRQQETRRAAAQSGGPQLRRRPAPAKTRSATARPLRRKRASADHRAGSGAFERGPIGRRAAFDARRTAGGSHHPAGEPGPDFAGGDEQDLRRHFAQAANAGRGQARILRRPARGGRDFQPTGRRDEQRDPGASRRARRRHWWNPSARRCSCSTI